MSKDEELGMRFEVGRGVDVKMIKSAKDPGGEISLGQKVKQLSPGSFEWKISGEYPVRNKNIWLQG